MIFTHGPYCICQDNWTWENLTLAALKWACRLLTISATTSNIYQLCVIEPLNKQARKPRSYASRNYDSLTGGKCRATSVAKKLFFWAQLATMSSFKDTQQVVGNKTLLIQKFWDFPPKNQIYVQWTIYKRLTPWREFIVVE